jgi:eukaryotic-like serine/threonine-protein kinase
MTRVDNDQRPPSGGGGGDGHDPYDQRLVDGEMVAGRYRVVRLIGVGAVGEVYEAHDEALGQDVALKTLRESVADDAVSIERFRREIQLARLVTHRNVCRTFDFGRHTPMGRGPLRFITMELLRGASLTETLAARGRYDVEEALPLVRQMVAGLAAAHAAGVIHRDFKPANLVLVPEAGGPRVVITDFGLARTYAEDETTITTTGEAVGTPLYMAPEQIVTGQQPITAATDIYALGIVLYEMVTGELPFKGSSITVMAIKRFREAAPSPRLVVPDLDARWDAAILRCLEREAPRRFQSAAAVEAALVSEAPPPASPAEGGPARGFFRRSSRRK